MRFSRRYQARAAEESRADANDIISWLRDYFSRRVNSRLMDERRCIPPYVVMDMGRRGIFGLHLETNDGGLALRCGDWARVFQQLAALDLSVGSWTAQQTLASRTLASFGSRELKDEFLADLAQGRILGAYAQSESDAGSDFQGMSTVARPNSSRTRWEITGEKMWIGSAGWAGFLAVIANTATGKTVFAVKGDTPGLEAGVEHTTMGLRAVPQNVVRFNRLEVPATWMIGEEDKGVVVSYDAMSFTRVTLAAHAIGAMKRCIQLMYRYASSRKIATGLLIHNPTALCFLSDSIVRTQAVETLLFKVLDNLDTGKFVSMEITAACKVLTSEFLFHISDQAVQLLGGRGYEENNYVAQIFRDARVFRIFEGPTETLLPFIGIRMQHVCERLVSEVSEDVEKTRRLVTQVQAAVERIHQQSDSMELSATQKLHWRNSRVGTVAVWAILAAACQHESPEIAEWTNERLTEAASRDNLAERACVPLFSGTAIEEAASAVARDIGDIARTCAGLSWDTDVVFR